MSKILVKDLKELAKQIDKTQTITFRDFEINLKTHLSITEKIGLVSSIYKSAIDKEDDLQVINYNALDIAYAVLVTKEYTNISLPENNVDGYDLLMKSGLYKFIYQSIPQEEIKELDEVLRNYTIEKKERYERENTLPNIVKNMLNELIGKVPTVDEAKKFIEDASKEISEFSPDKLEFIQDFLKANKGENVG